MPGSSSLGLPISANVNSPFENFLRDGIETFFYAPFTNWANLCRGWFSISPTIIFGGNLKDASIESHVLNEVGSYGKQLNRIIDVLTVLLSDLDHERLTPQEERLVYKFEELAQAADTATKNFESVAPDRELTRWEIDGLIDQMLSLQKSKPALFNDLSAHVRERLEKAQMAQP